VIVRAGTNDLVDKQDQRLLASVAPLLCVKGTGIEYAVPGPQNSAHSVDFKTVLTTQLLSDLQN